MINKKSQMLVFVLILGLIVVWVSWAMILGGWFGVVAAAMLAFVPFVFAASLLLCYLLGLGKGPPGPDN